jgi:hypothetical protein
MFNLRKKRIRINVISMGQSPAYYIHIVYVNGQLLLGILRAPAGNLLVEVYKRNFIFIVYCCTQSFSMGVVI